jgi:hypothetical protein
MMAAGQGLPVTRIDSVAARPVVEGVTSAAQLIAEAIAAGGGRTGLAGSLRSLFSR